MFKFIIIICSFCMAQQPTEKITEKLTEKLSKQDMKVKQKSLQSIQSNCVNALKKSASLDGSTLACRCLTKKYKDIPLKEIKVMEALYAKKKYKGSVDEQEQGILHDFDSDVMSQCLKDHLPNFLKASSKKN